MFREKLIFSSFWNMESGGFGVTKRREDRSRTRARVAGGQGSVLRGRRSRRF